MTINLKNHRILISWSCLWSPVSGCYGPVTIMRKLTDAEKAYGREAAKMIEDEWMATIEDVFEGLRYLGTGEDPISTSRPQNTDDVLVHATLPNGVQYSMGKLQGSELSRATASKAGFVAALNKVAGARPLKIWRLIWGL